MLLAVLCSWRAALQQVTTAASYPAASAPTVKAEDADSCLLDWDTKKEGTQMFFE
jgi:hypothetical protein